MVAPWNALKTMLTPKLGRSLTTVSCAESDLDDLSALDDQHHGGNSDGAA